MSWFNNIDVELKRMSIDNLIEPPAEINEGDNEVAVLNDPQLRAIFSLATWMFKKSAQEMVEAEFSTNNAAREDKNAAVYELKQKAKALMDMFWICIRDEYQLWDKPSIGIRKGWIVVWMKPKRLEFPGLFGRILGGDFGGDE